MRSNLKQDGVTSLKEQTLDEIQEELSLKDFIESLGEIEMIKRGLNPSMHGRCVLTLSQIREKNERGDVN